LQRRHQKLVEEAPSPYVVEHPELWDRMAEASRRLALAAGYVGAGTVEFMVDEASGEFYFLEVNARLQVEHPVTEAITGLDLVQWQLRIAMGERLEINPRLLKGDRSAITGHAVEVRVVAEDPARNFLPSVGPILVWAEPKAPGVRVDTGYGPGAEIPRYYDSLLAKVIGHAPDREAALAKVRAALEDFHILGVRTSTGYLLDVLNHPDVIAGRLDTGFLGREFGAWNPGEPSPLLGSIIEAARTTGASASVEGSSGSGAWGISDGFRNVR
jgi:acetyl/propionyl-CoA carboxylase alpha subunit